MNQFFTRALELQEEFRTNRRYLHEHAEVGLDLPETTRYLMKTLQEMGYEPQEIAPCSVVATLGNGKGKTFLLRSDADALPMEELSGLSYASCTPGHAHTCGHDMHMAMLLGAAKLLKERESELNGNVKFMFQPGEEIFAGCRPMVEAGLLENPKVDASMAIHTDASMDLGELGTCVGDMSTSVDGFRITIQGKGSHGAQPQNSIDPVNIGAHMVIALQEITSRALNPYDMGVLTVGNFSAGKAPNIIPDTAVLQGTMRAATPKVRALMKEKVNTIVPLTAKTFGGEATIEWFYDIPSIHNDETLTPELIGYIKEGAGDLLDTYHMDLHISPSDDYALVAERVPSTFIMVGAAEKGSDHKYAQHNPRVVFDEDLLPRGAGLLATCAYEWLKNHGDK